MIKKTSILLAALILGASTPLFAADSTPTPPQAESKEIKQKNTPFRGKLAQVDKTAMTITIAGKQKNRILHLTAKTKISKENKPATLADAVIGEEIGGLATRTPDGKEEIVTLRLGAKPQPTAKPKKTKKE